MRGVIFFVCLCFLLLRGYDDIRTGMLHPPFSEQPAHHHTGKSQPVKFTHKDQDPSEEELICEKVEENDDDDNNDAAKKVKLLPGSNLLLSQTADLNYLHTCSIDQQPFCGRSIYRYITQRALRI